MRHPYTKLLVNTLLYVTSITLYASNAGNNINGLTLISIALATIASINLARALATIEERTSQQ